MLHVELEAHEPTLGVDAPVSSSLWQDDDFIASNHHLVPARLVHVAHRLKQIDESDDTNTIAALGRMKLPQMTGQIRDVEQRALEIQREEGREQFRIKALHLNLVNHTVPSVIATLRADTQNPSHGSNQFGMDMDVDAGEDGADDDEERIEPSGLSAAAAGTLASGIAGLLPLTSIPSEGAGACSGAGAVGGGSSIGSSSEAAGLRPGGAGCSGGGAQACMHATHASSYVGLSHTFTAAAAESSHSLSAALSHGNSSSLAKTLAAGAGSCGGPYARGSADKGESSGSSGAGGASVFRCRIVPDCSMAMRSSAPGLSRGGLMGGSTSTTIVMRKGLVDVNPAPKPLDMRPGAADHALWYDGSW